MRDLAGILLHSVGDGWKRVWKDTSPSVYPTVQVLEEISEQVRTWHQERNQAHVTINQRFTATDARSKLKRLSHLLMRNKALVGIEYTVLFRSHYTGELVKHMCLLTVDTEGIME